MKPWEMGFAADLPEEEEPKPWEMGLAAVSTEESGGHKPWEMGLQAASSPPQEQGLLPAIETGAGEGVGWGTPSPPGATPYALPQMGHPPVPFPSLSDQVARRMVELYPVPKTVPLTTRFRETPGAVEPLGLGSPEKATAIGQREIQVPGEAVPEMTEGEREALAAVPVKGEEPPAPPLPPHAPLDKGDSSLPYPLQVGKKIFNDLLGNVTAQAKAEARSLPADLAHGLLYTQSRLIDRPGGNMAAAGLGVASAGAALVGMENIAKGLGDWARYYSGGTEITDWVNQENARRYEEAAKAGVVPAIVHTVMDSAAEFFGLATHMGAIGGRGVFTPGGFAEQAVKVGGLKPIFSHIGKLAAYGALTREGDVKQRAFNALRMVGYNITPYIANATGATGLTATSVDTLLNTFLSSPDYVAAWQNSENVKEFAKFAIPLVVMDIGMAWKTRGLPENQARAFFEKHDRKSAKKLGMDVEAYRTLREAVRTEAARAALAEAHQVADIIEARAAGRPSPEKPGEMRADGKFADLLADEQYALQQVQRVRDLGFRVDSVKLSWDRKVFVDPRTEEGRQRMIAGGKTPKEIDNAIANDKVFQIFGVFRIDRGGGQEDRCEVEFFGDANRSDINHELVHLIDKLGGLPGWTGTSEQRAEWLGRAMAEGSAWNLPELRPETARVQQPAAPVAQPPGLGGPRKVQDMVDRGVEAGNRRIALRQALEAGPPAPDTPIQGQEGAKAPLSPESRGTGGVEGEMSAREVKQEETRPGLAPAGSTERGMANPYANERGETLGRLGKAWQRGYDGVPMTKGTARGTAAYKAYQEGKQARDVTGIPTAESLRPVLSKRTKGDNLENAIDLVNDLQNKGGEFTPEGYAIVYHRTTPENAEKIVKDQKMVGKEDGLFFGTKPSGQIDGYGDAVVRVEIPVEKLLLNDVFSDEAHVRLPTKSVGREIPVRASIPAAQPAPADITEGSRMLEPAPAEQFSAREEETRGPVWYSRLERAIEAIKQEKMSPDQLAAAVTKNVDSEERKWTGLDDWIAEKKAAGEKVTKAEALAFVRANAVELIEVTKRDWMKVRPDDYDIFAQFRDEDDPERARLMAATETEDARIKEAGGEVRFSTYQLPGGDSYKELLITMPVTEDRQSWRAWASENGVSEGDVSIRLLQERSAPSDVIQSFERHMFPASRSKQSFTSSHWDEPNILAHVRFNERQAANGDKTLFLEEVQSDWHQAGKKQGYAGQVKSRFEAVPDPVNTGMFRVRKDGGPGWQTLGNMCGWDTMEAAQDAADRLHRLSGEAGVPDAPFKKTWHEMTFRRMLREAVAGGYDRIAWITGEQTAERYDLSKQVDEIRYGANDDGTYKIAVMKDGNAVLREEAATPDKLSELLGKDVTDRIVNRQGTQVPADGNRAAHTSLSGLNLKIGASWAKNFYDKALVNYANKFGKKFGARAEDVEIVPSPSSVKEAKNYNGLAVTPEAVTVHSLPITEQMRESVGREGVQMFSSREVSPPGDLDKFVRRPRSEAQVKKKQQAFVRADQKLADEIYYGRQIAQARERLEDVRRLGKEKLAERQEILRQTIADVKEAIGNSRLAPEDRQKLRARMLKMETVNADTPEKQANLFAGLGEMVAEIGHSNLVGDVRDTMGRLRGKLDTLEDPYRERVRQILESRQPSEPTDRKRVQLESRKDWLERLETEDPDGYAKALLLPQKLLDEIDRLDKMSLSRMTDEDLEITKDALEWFEKLSAKKATLKYIQKGREIREATGQLMDEVAVSIKELPPEKRDGRSWPVTTGKGVTTLLTTARRLGGTESVLSGMTRDFMRQDDQLQGLRKENAGVLDRAAQAQIGADYLSPKFQQYRDKLIKVKYGEGKDDYQKMTRGQYHTLLALIEDSRGHLSALAQMLNVGLTARTHKGVLGVTVPHATDPPWKPTFDQLSRIMAEADPKDLEAMRILRDQMNSRPEDLDKIVFDLTGRHLRFHENRWTILRERDYNIPERMGDIAESSVFRPEGEGTIKPRTGGKMPIVLADAYDVFSRIAEARAVLETMGPITRDSVVVLGQPKVKQALGRAIGRDGLKKIWKIIDYQARGGTVPVDSATGRLFTMAERGVAGAALPLRLTTAAVQPISTLFTFIDTPADVVLAGYSRYAAHPRDTDREMMEIPSAWMRYRGGTAQTLAQGPMGSARGYSKSAFEKLMKWSFFGDRIAMGMVYEVGKVQAERMGLTGDAAKEHAREYWLNEMNTRQPGGAPISVSGIYVDTRWEPSLRPFTFLSSQRNKIFNMLAQGVGDVNLARQRAKDGAGDRGEFAKALGHLAKTVGVVIAGQAAVAALRRKEKELLRGQDKAGFWTLTLDTLENLAGSVYVLGDLAKGLRASVQTGRVSQAAMSMGPIGSIAEAGVTGIGGSIKAAAELAEGDPEKAEKDLIRAAESLMRLASYKYGIPLSPQEYFFRNLKQGKKSNKPTEKELKQGGW